MKIFSALTVALLMIFQAVGFAATGTFSANGEYLMSDYDTPEIAEEIALDFAKQSAAEQAGVYLESYSRSVNFELEADEIKTVASSKVEVLEKISAANSNATAEFYSAQIFGRRSTLPSLTISLNRNASNGNEQFSNTKTCKK